MSQKQFIDPKLLQRWFKPGFYNIYAITHDQLLLQNKDKFNQQFKDDRDFFKYFMQKSLSDIPRFDLQLYFKDDIRIEDVFFALNLYYDFENNDIVDFYNRPKPQLYPHFDRFMSDLEVLLLSYNFHLIENEKLQNDLFSDLYKDLINYAKSQINDPLQNQRKQIDEFYFDINNQKRFILKHFSMKTLNNRTIKYKNIKIDNDLIREFMKVRYDYDTESIVRDQRSRSKDDEYSM